MAIESIPETVAGHEPGQEPWWADAVVYQVYPRSFRDSDGDGIGDLPGLTEKLPYIKDLGADIVWLCPVFASPNDDNGYDVSDYRAIMAEFGTMEDYDAFLARAHSLGLKVMMDLVVNHTSDEHEWFRRSRSSRQDPYRDYYIWRDPSGTAPDGTPLPPNNWGSEFGGSAWEYDAATGQFYLHSFSRKQPDLNWNNPAVRDEVVDLIRWWQAKGVDGWRVDAIGTIDKPLDFPDDPYQPEGRVVSSLPFINNGPRVHPWLHELHERAWAPDEAVTVGELAGPTPEDGVLYSNPARGELDHVIHFEHVSIGNSEDFGKWTLTKPDLPAVTAVLDAWQTGMHGRGWNALYWENHDQPRSVSRFGNDSPDLRERSAKALAAALYFQQGTPYVYQGQELGLANAPFSGIDEYRDLDSINWYREMVEERELLTPEQALAYLHEKSRDHARTPMPWSDGGGAGFGTGTPWIGLNPSFPEVNAAEQETRPDSVLSFYRELFRIRKGAARDVVVRGSYEPLLPGDESVWAYDRVLGGTRLRVVANLGDAPAERDAAARPEGARLLLSTVPDDAGRSLRPWEAKVYLVDDPE